MRRLRGEDVLPYMDNTAIEHQPEKRRIECDPEFYLNDTLHKLPRQSVRLDWIGQMKTALEENNEKVIAATEKALPSKKEGKKPEVSPQKGKGKEFFLGDEVGKDLVGSKGKGKEFVPTWIVNRLENGGFPFSSPYYYQ